jgi:hypothetical protein
MRAYVGLLSVAKIPRKIYKQAGFLGSAIGEKETFCMHVFASTFGICLGAFS